VREGKVIPPAQATGPVRHRFAQCCARPREILPPDKELAAEPQVLLPERMAHRPAELAGELRM
jgi:hypothetical protein